LLLKAENYALAEVEYSKLLEENADNVDYLDGLEKSRQLDGDLSEEKREKLFRLYSNLSVKYPNSHAIAAKPLRLATVSKLRQFAEPLLIKMLRKGVPSLFNSMKDLLVNSEKAVILEETIMSLYAKLVEGSGFTIDEEQELPCTFLWTVYFISQLYDFKGEIATALEFIDMAIDHSPTVVELHMFKARIFKHAGNNELAMNAMDFARNLDLQDRFVNSKCTKYMLRNNKISDAETTIALFTKPDDGSVSANQDLIDMQCSWYAYASAQIHQRFARFGLALKRYNQIYRHFNEFTEDQIDFHTYAIRKQTLRSYGELVKTFATIRKHRFYALSAKAAFDTHLLLFEGGDAAEQMVDGVSLFGVTEAERKKLVKKSKKLKALENEKVEGKKEVDDYGTQFVVGVDHLSEAARFLKPLLLHASNDLEVLERACRLYLLKSIAILT
jgi:peptide alpha-N-acetyltransferase